MKNVLRFLAINAVVAAAALSAFAQTPAASPAASPAADADAAAKAACTALYTKWRDNYKGDANAQKLAYEEGKKFLAQCPNDEYVKWVANWVPKYEAVEKETRINNEYAEAFKNKNWAGVVNTGKQIVASKPDNLRTFVGMAYAASQNAAPPTKSDALNQDGIRASRQAIQLIEAGKADAFTPQQWKELGFTNKGELTSWLNYTVGFLSFSTAPADTAASIVKAVQGEGTFKRDPGAYYLLALAYQNAEYAPLAKDYEANCAGKDLTDDCKVKLDKMNLVVDRIIDAMARAVSLATDPKLAASKADWMTQLETFYKFRHEDKTDGLNEMIAGIQAKPLLLPSMQTMPTPSTTPATTATPTGANTSGASPAAGTTSSTPPASTTNTAKPADTATPKPAPKPDATKSTGNGAKPLAMSRAKSRASNRASSKRP